MVISQQPLLELFWNFVRCIVWSWNIIQCQGHNLAELDLGYISATPPGIFLKLCQMYCWVMGHHSTSECSRSRSYFGKTWPWLCNLTLVNFDCKAYIFLHESLSKHLFPSFNIKITKVKVIICQNLTMVNFDCRSHIFYSLFMKVYKNIYLHQILVKFKTRSRGQLLE